MKIIHWKSKITNESGHGTGSFPDEQAENIVKIFNEKYPDLIHWSEEVKGDEN